MGGGGKGCFFNFLDALYFVFCHPPPPRFATISLAPDSEGHKPKRKDKNSCGVT